MISVKFFAQDIKNKNNKVATTTVYFEELDDYVNILIKAQRVQLETALPDFRIVALITRENEE